MEIVKDTLKVEEPIGYEEAEPMVETEIYVDQTKPDIENILWADGKVEILSTKVIQDKILINGLVKFKVVYKSTEEELNIYSLEDNKDFKEEIFIDGLDESMAVDIKPNVEFIEYDLVDERKVSLQALISLSAKVEKANTVEIIQEITEKSNLQLLKEKIQYNDIISREESYALIKEAFEVEDDQPPIEEVLKVDIHPYEKEVNISSDRIIVSGVLECSIIYFGGNKINSTKREIPFTHFMDAENIEYDSKCQLKMEVISGEYEVRENLEGQSKILDLEAKVRISAKLYNQKEKEVIVDAYSTEEKLNLQLDEIKVIENIKEIVNKEEVSREISYKEFKEIYAIEGSPKVIDSQYVDDKIVVEGLLPITVYYMDKIDDKITTYKEEIPFKFYINADDLGKDVVIDTEAALESIRYALRDDVLLIDATIKNRVSVNRERKIKVVNNIEETGELIDKKNRPSIIVYMVQKDDQLWDIAKRYNTTMEEIIESNNIINPSSLMPGEKIIIEKKVDIDF